MEVAMLEWMVAMFARLREFFEAVHDRGIGPSWVWKHNLEIILGMTILVGLIKRKAETRSTIIVGIQDLQTAYERKKRLEASAPTFASP
jgi:hypothetical protein